MNHQNNGHTTSHYFHHKLLFLIFCLFFTSDFSVILIQSLHELPSFSFTEQHLSSFTARIPIVHNADTLLLELLCPDSRGSQWKYRSEAVMIWRICVIVLLQQYYLYLLNCAANFCLSIAFYAFLFSHKIGSCYSRSPVSKQKSA